MERLLLSGKIFVYIKKETKAEYPQSFIHLVWKGSDGDYYQSFKSFKISRKVALKEIISEIII